MTSEPPSIKERSQPQTLKKGIGETIRHGSLRVYPSGRIGQARATRPTGRSSKLCASLVLSGFPALLGRFVLRGVCFMKATISGLICYGIPDPKRKP